MPPNKNWDDNYDRTFHKSENTPTKSKYKAKWDPFSQNTEFWAEVLVGRTIVDIKFDDSRLCALKLDNGEVVKIINNENGVGVIAIED